MKYFNAYYRHLFLMLCVGFIWGYVAKVFMSAYFYIGFDDPHAVHYFEAFIF